MGINTDEMDEALSISGVVIARKLNKLLIGESRIRINKQELYIGDKFAQRYLEEGRTYLLPKGENNNDNQEE